MFRRRGSFRGLRLAAALCGSLLVSLSGCTPSGRAGAASADDAAGEARGAARGDRWVALETPHFSVSTDAAPERALALARQLEQSRTMLLAAAWPMARDPGGRTRVVIFSRAADFQRYTGTTARVGGVSISRTGVERTIAFTPGPEGGLPRVAVHELAHDLSQWFFPLQPAWFSEGLAVYLENTRHDRRSGRVVLGEASAESLRWLQERSSFASAALLFDTSSPHSAGPRDESFHAGSWFLVTYLLNGETASFELFQKRLHQLVPWRRAWDEAFDGMTTVELDRKLQAYARAGGDFTIMSGVVGLPEPPIELRTLSAAQAHGVRALLASARAPDVAEREMRAALGRDPYELNALWVGFHGTDRDQEQARRELAERAVRAHPHVADAWLLRALSAAEASARREAVQQAASLDPEHPGAALLVADDALAHGKPAVAVEKVRFALQRSPLSANMLGLYAAALEASGRCEQATFIAESASSLLAPSCILRHPATHERIGCAAYVQSRVGSPNAPCKPARQSTARRAQ